MWVVFDWDQDGWQSFVSDPEVPAIMKEAGHKGRPQAAQFAGRWTPERRSAVVAPQPVDVVRYGLVDVVAGLEARVLP